MIRILALAAGASLMLSGAALAQGDGPSLRDACAKDVQTLCAGVQPGGGRIMACFREHQDKVSPACKAAMVQAMAARRAAGDGTGATAPQPH